VPLDRNRVTWTSAELLTEVRRKAALASGSLKWTDAVLLREATDVLRSFAGWAMAKAGEGRNIVQLERTTAITTAYGTSREITLPPHAVADTIDSVFWVDTAGKEFELMPLDLASQPKFDQPDSQGNPTHYAVLSGSIRIYPEPLTVSTFRINYTRRHPELIATDSTTIVPVTGASGSTSTSFAVASHSYATGEGLDLVNVYWPYRVLLADMVITASSAIEVTVAVPYTQVSGLSPTGSVLVPSGTSPYVHLPQEFRACVSFKLAEHVLGMIGDEVGAQTNAQRAEAELARVVDLLNPRVKSQRQKLINPHSLMRSRARRGGWN
jgi:hypothetical protein